MCLNWVTIAVIKQLTKNSLMRKGFTCFMLPYHNPSLKEIRPGTRKQELLQTIEGTACWLAAHGLLSLILIEPRTPAQGWPHQQWARPSPINHWFRKCPAAGSDESIFSVEGPSFQMILVRADIELAQDSMCIIYTLQWRAHHSPP